MYKTLVTLILLLASCAAGAAPISVASARVWPGTDYTRITFETVKPVDHKMTVMKNPDRLVIDLENVDFNTVLKSLADKVQGSDPYVKKIRTAVFKPGTIRVVVELKQEAKPSFFALKPAGTYKHRLVLDIYPKADPLMALLEQRDGVATEQSGGWSPNAPASQPANPNLPAETAPEVATAPVTTEPTTTAANEETPAPTEEAPIPKDGVERLITVAVDAGHGGEDSGAHGANGTYEKDVTLAIAKKLKGLIDAEPNMRGVLTRDSDYFIPLHGRVVKARKLQADLFVSVHADAFTRQDARGSSVFALSERGATSAMARLLAKHENESDLIGGVNIDTKDPYLARTLLDLSQTATISDSLKLAKSVLGHLGEINDLHKGSVEQAGFAVLKAPDIPSILVETAFISNPEEEKRLNDEEYQTKMANAILSGIKRYFASNPPLSKGKKVVFND
jgi:N-acetylmuramoyl-L-alanine amidase